jgi:transcriptional regulator
MKGTLDMLLLQALSGGAMHGYGIAQWLQRTTDDAFQVEEGSLYPALHRLMERGWVKASWGTSENNRRARYYTLTPVGRKQLGVETATWSAFIAAVAKVLRTHPAAERGHA